MQHLGYRFVYLLTLNPSVVKLHKEKGQNQIPYVSIYFRLEKRPQQHYASPKPTFLSNHLFIVRKIVELNRNTF